MQRVIGSGSNGQGQSYSRSNGLRSVASLSDAGVLSPRPFLRAVTALRSIFSAGFDNKDFHNREFLSATTKSAAQPRALITPGIT